MVQKEKAKAKAKRGKRMMENGNERAVFLSVQFAQNQIIIFC